MSAETPAHRSTGNAAQTAAWKRLSNLWEIYDWEMKADANVHVLLDVGDDGDWVVIFPDGTTLGEDEVGGVS